MPNKTSQLMHQHIIDTTMRILQTVPFSKITIKQICETADINRNTFYRHFHDKYDLTSTILDVTFQNFFHNVDFEVFKQHPFTVLKDLQLNHYVDILDFQLKDSEFKPLFDSASFRRLFQLSDDPDFIWTIGKMYVVNTWNQQLPHPYDTREGCEILDEIIRTKRFPTPPVKK